MARKSPPQPLKPLSAGKPLLRGFDAIAGMEDLKRILNDDVVGALKDREQYGEYGLEIPNGMLLYGQRCGKTFMAERFAEEVGLNFRFAVGFCEHLCPRCTREDWPAVRRGP